MPTGCVTILRCAGSSAARRRRADQGLIADEPEGEADQDRRQVVSHGRYVAFQMAEVAIPRNLFADVLRLIAELRPPPVTSTA